MFVFDNGAPPSDGYTLMSRLAATFTVSWSLVVCTSRISSLYSCFLILNTKKKRDLLSPSGGRLQWNAISHFYGILLKSDACEPHLLMLQRRNEQMLLPIGLN